VTAQAEELDDLLDFAEAARRLRMSESWLRHKVARREVAHTRIGRRVRFTAENIAEIIAAGRVGADTRRKR
jgi:excisionase family DNA binding protein